MRQAFSLRFFSGLIPRALPRAGMCEAFGLWSFRRSVFAGVAFLGAHSVLMLPVLGSPLDDRITAFKAAATQEEAAVSGILQFGLDENRSALAFASVKPWLTANPELSQPLLMQAARSAERAGEWQDAASFYRKLLGNPQVDPTLAAEAVPAAYRLFINHLADPDAAYLFMREDGARLRTFGRARQFDSWFLTRAAERGDLIALAEWLAVIHDGDDALEPFAEATEALLGELETYRHDGAELFDALKKLAAARRTPPSVKARLTWVMEVVPFQKKAAELLGAKQNVPDSLMDGPLRAAGELIAVLPFEGSVAVSRGWMHFNVGDSGFFRTFVDPRRAEKAAPLLQALGTLPPEKTRVVLGMAVADAKGRKVGDYLFTPAELRALVNQVPAVFNSLDAPDVPLFDKTLTVEEARALSPRLARNPQVQAALVRMWANPERRFSVVIDAIIKSEAWRNNDIKVLTQTVWQTGMFEKDTGNPEESNRKHAALDSRYQALAKQVDAASAGGSRLGAFETLRRDLLSAAPSIPGALALWDKLFAMANNEDALKMLDVLVADPAGEQEILLRRALGHVSFDKSGRMPWQAVAQENHPRFHQQPTRKVAAALIQKLGGMIEAQARAGSISETLFGMWLHSVDPSDPEARERMRRIVAAPAYAKLDAAYRRTAAGGGYFGSLAKTGSAADADAEILCRELLALGATPAPAEVESALRAAVDRISRASAAVPVIGLAPVAALENGSPQVRSDVMSLFSTLSGIGPLPPRQGYEALIQRLLSETTASGNFGGLEALMPGLWHAAAATDDARVYPAANALSIFAEAAMEANQPSIAMSIARGGMKSTVGRMLATASDPRLAEIHGRLRKVAGKAALAVGAIEIPVAESDPAYPVYQSHADFVQGNLDSSWTLYDKHADRLTGVLRGLSVEYGLWLLQRNIDADQPGRAEELIKELTIWSRQAEGVFSPEQDARLKIAYADLAFREGALPTARAWYRKVADAAEYAGSSMYLDASLGSVKVDRVTRNFSAALTELDRLMRLKNPDFRIRVRYARAEVLMDQENFAEALGELEEVLRQEPKHPDALILRGQIHYQMRKLIEASEIELGPSQEDTLIVPGEVVKINLRDPTLRVSGVGADIEAEIRAKSGDVVRVLLYQLGDSKEKFRAEVPTELGSPNPNDKVLQVLGVDEIRFGFSDRFRAKMDDLPPDPDLVIGVASDAQLDLTAGAFPPREGERRLAIEELGLDTAQAALGTRAVRPGNPVYLRVTDPDRSVSPGIDEVIVSLRASSGDEIRQLVLRETSPYSGEFEAVVPTAGAQALAFASESAPGRDPNMAVSSKDYPGWQGQVGARESARIFGVDLNDNVAMGRMTVAMSGDDGKLTHFVLQTSMNGRDWTTRARFPEDAASWDGRPQFTSFPTFGNHSLTISNPEGRELPVDWLEKMELTSASASYRYLAAHVTGLSAKEPPLVETSHPGHSALIRYRAVFHQPSAAIRRFQLTGLPGADDKGVARTIFLLDGEPAGETSESPFLIEREITAGLHEIEVWCHLGRAEFLKLKPALLCDEPGKPDLVPCPDAMFDPSAFPEGVRAMLPQPAKISANGSGLDIDFGDATRARMARFVIQGFSGVAPAITKVTLTNREGGQVLPVAQDFMELRGNSQLEVLPGDQVIARYEDPVPATPKRTRHDRDLGVAFNTGTITASFLNYETNSEGERVLMLEPIRRFRHDDAIAVVIDDADLDGGPDRDMVEFTVTSSDGATATFQAVETGEHSGRFIGRVFPVEGEPARASEIKLSKGGTLTATYRDAENLDPGIPYDRSVSFSHAHYGTPLLDAYAMTSEALALPADEGAATPAIPASGPEVFAERRSLSYGHVAAADQSKEPLEALIGAGLRFDVVAPHLALAGSSGIRAYVQTEAARKAADASGKPFDVTLPGTLKLTGTLAAPGIEAPLGYRIETPATPPTNAPPLEEGRFSFAVPLILGDPPERSFATKSADELPDSAIPEGLAVKAGDIVHIGFPWQDEEKKVHWKTASFTVGSHAFLDVMQNGYREPLDRAYVGEKVYLRLLAPGLDRGPERDTAEVDLKGSGGASSRYELTETEGHSGIFKAVFTVSYADDQIPSQLPPVALNGFPVRYGDEISVAYDDQTLRVGVNKGADGVIEPFSKRFTGDDMAVRTSFALAECYFELAKKHREMEQESLARREIGQARKLLAEALATHSDEELKAHAEYLLGNLSQEFADLAKNDESKLPLYQDALARFSKIPTDYPESEFASKAQFKTALTYEKMGEIENSVEEYVKLAYKYPNDELIPVVMSRLGGYFQTKGQAFKEQADALREKEDGESKAEVLRLDELSFPEFLNAAMVFSKLQERFPDDPLAGLAGLRAAQNFMRAHQYEEAIKRFVRVIDNEQYDGPEIRAQAIYWSGVSHERSAGIMSEADFRGRGTAIREAYQLYRRVTFDFPDSIWAKYARGRLADPVFAEIIRIENLERERMIETLNDSIKERKR